MAIAPPVDIVMDVLKAADPAAVAKARQKLATAANASSATFEATPAGMPDLRGEPLATRVAATTARPEAHVRFEAMVLQNFVKAMLPEDAQSVYGGGVAGEMWRSMMAERLADQLATSGSLGIADRILGHHVVENEERVAVRGINGDPARREQADRQALLSTALVDEIQRTILNRFGADEAQETGRDAR